MRNIYKYIISIVVICIFFTLKMQAQNNRISALKDSIAMPKIPSNDTLKTIVDSVQKATDSNILKKPKWYKSWTPIGIYIGADVAKIALSIANKNNTKIESIIDIYCKNTNWIGINVGYTNATFTSANLKYASQSSGLLFTIQKSLFPFVYKSDRDNAFIGIGYGIAFNRIGQATYDINDIWGATNGVIDANINTAHFVELNAGFRMAITNRIMIGWRMQGKTILNSKVFSDISPITIANYGSGDKGSVFGYNLAVTYRVF
jgi:Domain of unknown function (DUF6048)